MDLLDIHIKEILEIKKKVDTYKYYKPKTIYLLDPEIGDDYLAKDKYIETTKEMNLEDRIIAGYFKRDDIFYYLEKIYDDYILTQRARQKEIKVLLDRNRWPFINDEFSLKDFKNFCYEMLHKGLFDYKKEDIED